MAGSNLAVVAVVRDRFGNLITNAAKLILASGFSNVRVVAKDPQVALRDDGSFTRNFGVSSIAKASSPRRSMSPLRVIGSFPWFQNRRRGHTSPVTSRCSRANSAPYQPRSCSTSGRSFAPAAGNAASFSIQLRAIATATASPPSRARLLRGVLPRRQDLWIEVDVRKRRLTLEPRNEQMGVYDVVYRTTIVDTYLIRLTVQGVRFRVGTQSRVSRDASCTLPARSTVKGAAKGTRV